MTTAELSRIALWVALAVYGIAGALYVRQLRAEGAETRRASRASAVAWTGAAVHLGSVVLRGVAAGRPPWGNMYEFSSLVSLVAVAGYLLFVEGRMRVRTLGAFVLGFAVVTMGVASLALYTRPAPLAPALNSTWREIHVISVIAGSALLTLGGIFSILYLVKERSERRRAAADDAVTALAAREAAPIRGGSIDLEAADAADPPDFVRGADEPAAVPRRRRGILPASETLDRLAYRTIAVAFPVWTFAVIAGAIWAERAWGRYWGWDPKETWAFITWVVFAGYLHARATSGWKGRRAAWVAVVGFVSLLITYYVVNLFVVGLHSYAGV